MWRAGFGLWGGTPPPQRFEFPSLARAGEATILLGTRKDASRIMRQKQRLQAARPALWWDRPTPLSRCTPEPVYSVSCVVYQQPPRKTHMLISYACFFECSFTENQGRWYKKCLSWVHWKFYWWDWNFHHMDSSLSHLVDQSEAQGTKRYVPISGVGQPISVVSQPISGVRQSISGVGQPISDVE